MRRFDVQKLQKKNIKEIFQIQTRNRYELLGEMQDDDDDEKVEQQSRRVKEIWNKTAEETLGYKNVHRKDWISAETWQKVEERKNIKL